MAQLTEAAAEKLPQHQAAGLARLIDLHARWENLREYSGRPASEYTAPDLHRRQKAYEAFRIERADYTGRYRTDEVPEATCNTPVRVVVWCRAVNAVLRRAEVGECPVAAVEKAYRMADRIAARVKREQMERKALLSLSDAILALDGVIQWCDALASTPAPIGQE